jgi:drug/metabolite transporter (DMT)-like permease
MVLIIAGALVLSWQQKPEWNDIAPAVAVLGACLAWGIDNNLTRKVALADATYIAMAKGLAAGSTNLFLALVSGASLPAPAFTFATAGLGVISYGASLALFVIALRQLGTARTGAYFSTAPFAGMAISLMLLHEPLTIQLGAATFLMALGVWLHLTERHEHMHSHEALEHKHAHTHDIHHQHPHDEPIAPDAHHTHWHRHEPLVHNHAHYPDAHHRHLH